VYLEVHQLSQILIIIYFKNQHDVHVDLGIHAA
jgi:hypothetical protein